MVSVASLNASVAALGAPLKWHTHNDGQVITHLADVAAHLHVEAGDGCRDAGMGAVKLGGGDNMVQESAARHKAYVASVVIVGGLNRVSIAGVANRGEDRRAAAEGIVEVTKRDHAAQAIAVHRVAQVGL